MVVFRLREAGKINSSLSILSQVVRELAENGGSSGHVPYRDSKLTFLLMNSLGGTGKAAVIATLNQQQQHSAETRSTLAFAALSKGVRLRPVANQTLTLSHGQLPCCSWSYGPQHFSPVPTCLINPLQHLCCHPNKARCDAQRCTLHAGQ